MREWKMPSATRPGVEYTVKEHADQSLSCDCPAWLYPKGGRPRGCAHTMTITSLRKCDEMNKAAEAPAATKGKKKVVVETTEETARVFRRLS